MHTVKGIPTTNKYATIQGARLDDHKSFRRSCTSGIQKPYPGMKPVLLTFITFQTTKVKLNKRYPQKHNTKQYWLTHRPGGNYNILLTSANLPHAYRHDATHGATTNNIIPCVTAQVDPNENHRSQIQSVKNVVGKSNKQTENPQLSGRLFRWQSSVFSISDVEGEVCQE